MQTKVLNVEGMSCEHCVNAVKGAVGELAGISSVDVDLQAKTATVAFEEGKVKLEEIKDAIEEQGFDVVN